MGVKTRDKRTIKKMTIIRKFVVGVSDFSTLKQKSQTDVQQVYIVCKNALYPWRNTCFLSFTISNDSIRVIILTIHKRNIKRYQYGNPSPQIEGQTIQFP